MMLFLEFNLVHTNKPVTINVEQIVAVEAFTEYSTCIELANGTTKIVNISYKTVIDYMEYENGTS